MIFRAFSISQFQFDGAQLIPHRLARVFCTGIIPGLLWKKIYRYTVINYNDGYMDQVISVRLPQRCRKGFKQDYTRRICG